MSRSSSCPAGRHGGGAPRASAAPTDGNVVIATADIPLSTRIGADQVTVKVLDLTSILPGAFSDPSQIIGRIVRQPVRTGAQITTETIGAVNGTVVDVQVPAGLRAIAVRVDQTSGVGTVIKSGDYVDSIIALNEQTVRLGRPGRLRRRHRHEPGSQGNDDQAHPPGDAGPGHAAAARRGTVRRGLRGTIRRARARP